MGGIGVFWKTTPKLWLPIPVRGTSRGTRLIAGFVVFYFVNCPHGFMDNPQINSPNIFEKNLLFWYTEIVWIGGRYERQTAFRWIG
ncbi:MAG: hypothetical protein BV459_00245 [Thermoplasmata archaeon M11B2D]|nr:MAG: hypothetical protein BV459_00245 [Thermoplasmata archaeon M11B2D]